jgi:DNA-directed RNA polymerase specialized sigma24 family protein
MEVGMAPAKVIPSNLRDADERTYLERISKALAVIAMQLMLAKDPSLKERAAFLARLGFATAEIADLLGSTTATIAPYLSRSRKAKPKRRN